MTVSRSRLLGSMLTAVMLLGSLGVFTPGAGATTAMSGDPRLAKAADVLGDAAPGAARVLPPLPDDADDTVATAQPLLATAAGTVDVDGDRIDVYSMALTAGDRVGVRVTGDATLDADAYLYAPGITDLVGTAALAGTIGDAFGKALVFNVETSGTYHLAVTPAAGAGAYTLTTYSYPWAGLPDNDIPGVSLAASPVAAAADADADPDDVYAVSLAGGDRLTATVVGAALNADLYLFGPAATTILTGVPVAGSASAGVGGSETFVFDIPTTVAAADYYLDVRASAGTGAYTLTWEVTTLAPIVWNDETDALALTIGTRDAGLDRLTDANDVYRVDLAAGERLSLGLTGPAGADYDLYVYGPGTTNLLAALPVVWSNDSTPGESLVFDCTASGTYYVEVRAFAGSGDYSLSSSVSDTPAFGAAVRLEGPDRYATAIAASAAVFADGSCPTVVIATGENFPDALSASALAGAYGAPTLLTRTASLPSGVVTELKRLGATTAVIVGGEGAVGPGVVTALRAAGIATDRVYGNDRYLTAAAVARRVRTVTGARDDLTAFLVRGDDFADATAVAPYAYRNAFPVLLVTSSTMPAATSAVMTEIGVKHVVVAGGTGVISPTVEQAALGASGVLTTHREGGADRYETAAKIATYGTSMWWGANTVIGLATGSAYADALGGGVTVGERGGVLLLTRTTDLPAATSAYLEAASPEVRDVSIFGGTAAVSDAVKATVNVIVSGH